MNYRLLLSFIAAMCLTTSLLGAPTPKNTLVICIDGVNKETLNALLQKDRLPNLQKLIRRGSMQQISLAPSGNTPHQAYAELLTGTPYEEVGFFTKKPKPLASGSTFIEKIFQTQAFFRVGLFLSSPAHPDSPSLNILFKKIAIPREQSPEKPRVTTETAQLVTEFINETEGPFVVIANFTSPEKMAHTYREGAEIYSQSLVKVDHSIGTIIHALYKKKQLRNTRIWITTSYPMDKHKRTHATNLKGWIISSEKMNRSGNRLSLAPTILASYRIAIPPTLKEKPLISAPTP